MAIQLGSSAIDTVMLGSSQVDKIMLGSDEVWSAGPPEPNIIMEVTVIPGTTEIRWSSSGGTLEITQTSDTTFSIIGYDIETISRTSSLAGYDTILSVDVTLFDPSFDAYESFAYLTVCTDITFSSENMHLNQALSISKMFDSCSSLTSLTTTNFNTVNCTNCSSMFADLTSATFIDLTDMKLTSMTDMGSLIYGSDTIEYVLMPQDMLDNPPAADMTYMFDRLSNLLCINHIDSTNATDTFGMFSDCPSLLRPTADEIDCISGGCQYINDDNCPASKEVIYEDKYVTYQGKEVVYNG